MSPHFGYLEVFGHAVGRNVGRYRLHLETVELGFQSTEDPGILLHQVCRLGRVFAQIEKLPGFRDQGGEFRDQ